jgi:peptide/nickel transport system permease protein
MDAARRLLPGLQRDRNVRWPGPVGLPPALAFGAVFAAIYARMIRASVLEVYDADHVRTARAIGMSEGRILRTQVLRNALLPVVTMLGMDMGLAFGGAIFVERAFGLPGVGRLLISSLGGRDLPVILGIVVLVTTAILLFNLLVDLLYPLLDPRIGYGGASQSAKARSKWPRGRAPTTVVLGSPPSNRITVGSERTP